VHVRKGAWRYIAGIAALVAFTIALPLAQSPVVVKANQSIGGVTFATDPNSIARGGGLCPQGLNKGGPTDENCYVSATTDETGVDILDPSFDPVGVPHTFVFTCGPATADLFGTGATEPTAFGTPAGCYDVQATVKNESLGADPSIDFARCGYNTAHVTGSTANCNSTQSPLCPAGDDESNQDQGDITNSGDASACTSEDNNVPFGQEMAIRINPGAPDAYLITFTGLTLPCGGTEAVNEGPPLSKKIPGGKNGIHSAQAFPGSTGNPCTSEFSSTTASEGVQCPTGMTYLPSPGGGPTSGYAVTVTVGVLPM